MVFHGLFLETFMKVLGPNILRRHSEWPLIEAVGVYFGKRLKTLYWFAFFWFKTKKKTQKDLI